MCLPGASWGAVLAETPSFSGHTTGLPPSVYPHKLGGGGNLVALACLPSRSKSCALCLTEVLSSLQVV